MPDRALIPYPFKIKADRSTAPPYIFSYGSFDANANITNPGSRDWTVTRTATGIYQVNNPLWTTPSYGPLITVIDPGGAIGLECNCRGAQIGNFGVGTFKYNGTFTNAAVCFAVYFSP